ncbi:hypothetical protein [Flavobacterium caeni]|uniref:Uncharacterized protein n=1 Tax=Flavobacterium caeni TaxID=490189 RepID=A0A1G5D2Z0_9FLAO|nr:hypothetical protein [Flavobacterium caeni]SCY08830.1 hypothetical protein SAMN02927903_00720 [Flavobacterium caeni]
MRVDLKQELLKQRNKSHEDSILREVASVLALHEQRRAQTIDALQNGTTAPNQMIFDLLETDRIFSLSQIRKVCIDYRLRFLESQRFRNHFPEEALSAIRELENRHQTRLGHFRIMAPTGAFKLDNYDDPLLFVPLDNDYFYLVHQWGGDLGSVRKWLVLPLRNLGWFTAFCVLLSLLLTWMIPINQLGEKIPWAKLIIFLFLFKSVFAVAMYGFFMRGRSFSAQMWDSRFYNQ